MSSYSESADVSSLALARALVERLEANESPEDTIALREALHRVKAENSRLKDENDELRLDLDHLQGAFEEHVQILQTINACRAPLRQPPPEILQIIFRYAFPPDFLLDASLSAGPESPWCLATRMKLSVIRVCKIWYRVGLELLYENISFRRIGQISAFLRTLDDNPFLGTLVKAVTVHCFVPHGYSVLYDENLKRILHDCFRIKRIAFSAPRTALQTDRALPLLTNSITHLECGPTDDFDSLSSALFKIKDMLVSLTIHVPVSRVVNGERLRLQCLKKLRFRVHHHMTYHTVSGLASEWILPSLESLTFDLAGDASLGMGPWEQFCTGHGRNLKKLAIVPIPWRDAREWTLPELQNTLDVCPSLEHIVIPSFEETEMTVSHPNVKWIEIWRSTDSSQVPEFPIPRGFPAFRGFRAVDCALTNFPDITTLCPPHEVTDAAGSYEYKFPGIHIRHDPQHLYMKYILDEDEATEDGETLDDDESESDEERSDTIEEDTDISDSGDDSTDDYCSEDELSDFEVYERDGMWLADNESTLDIYSEMDS